MAASLPRLPRGESKLTYVSNYIDLTPGGGGSTQRISKLGDRFRYEHSFILRGVQAMGVAAVLNANVANTVSVPISQAIQIGNPGSTVQANGASQGRSLKLKGLTPSYPFRAGQYISITRSGRSYLHQVTADVQALVNGTVTLAIVPTLRVPILGNEVVAVANPIIEGFLTTREQPYVTNTFVASVKLEVSILEAE